jgi:hypothetical protein
MTPPRIAGAVEGPLGLGGGVGVEQRDRAGDVMFVLNDRRAPSLDPKYEEELMARYWRTKHKLWMAFYRRCREIAPDFQVTVRDSGAISPPLVMQWICTLRGHRYGGAVEVLSHDYDEPQNLVRLGQLLMQAHACLWRIMHGRTE